IGQAYFKQQFLDSASTAYEVATTRGNKSIASIAHLQLGNLLMQKEAIELTTTAYQTMKPEQISRVKEAAERYKKALIADHSNEKARYNYEALKKWLDNIPEDKKEEQQKHEEEQEQKKQEE